jgi:hypothetical protein
MPFCCLRAENGVVVKHKRGEIQMVSTFKERLAPLANSGLTKAEMNKALVYCGADEFIGSLEDRGVSKLDAFILLGQIINELSLFDNSSR